MFLWLGKSKIDDGDTVKELLYISLLFTNCWNIVGYSLCVCMYRVCLQMGRHTLKLQIFDSEREDNKVIFAASQYAINTLDTLSQTLPYAKIGGI